MLRISVNNTLHMVLMVPGSYYCILNKVLCVSETSFHACLSIFTGSQGAQCLSQNALGRRYQIKWLGVLYKGSASCLQLNTSSFFLFQIHEFKDTSHSAADKHTLPTRTHPQASTNSIFCFLLHIHTQFHT